MKIKSFVWIILVILIISAGTVCIGLKSIHNEEYKIVSTIKNNFGDHSSVDLIVVLETDDCDIDELADIIKNNYIELNESTEELYIRFFENYKEYDKGNILAEKKYEY